MPTRLILTPIAALSLLGLAVLPGCYRGVDAAPDESDGDGDGEGEGGSADADDGSADDDGPASDPLISECRRPTYEVYRALEPSCAGCHGEGTSVPLMADFVAFEQLVVYDESLVVPGDPAASRLLAMMRGEGPPPLTQMPPGALDFEELEAEGRTEIGLSDLEAWISALEPCEVPGGLGSPRFARRVRVEQVRATLLAQLDLTLADVEHATRYPLDDPTFPALPSGHNSSGAAHARWKALGGPDTLLGSLRTTEWSPQFIQTIGPMAQAWCRRSITLGRTALLRHASADSDSATQAAAIEANIAYLYLHMLGVVATDEEDRKSVV